MTDRIRVRVAAGSDDLTWCAAHDGYLDAEALERKAVASELLVAELDGQRVGLLRLDHLWSTLPHIAQVRVLEPFRRRAVGRALVEFAAAQARARGAPMLLSSTRTDKRDAQAWHRAVGFIGCGSLSGLGPAGEPTIFYRKPL